MAAKRLRDEQDERDPDRSSGDKRMRTVTPLPTVFRQVLAVKSLQNVADLLEPLLRRVVQEEVERGLFQGTRLLQRSPQRQIQAASADVNTTLKLVFSNGVDETLYTGSKIEDREDNPLRIHLVDISDPTGTPVSPRSPIRVEILVIDGDFPGERDDWTSEEFGRKIVKERVGKRPLLNGDVLLTLRDGSSTIGDLAFTDNSSWIRSRHFRLGARIAPGSGEGRRVKEGMTEPFMVKDHRGELYKKHYPPALHDEVWRLRMIAKDGVFHKKLQGEHINTVQDFLKLWVIDRDRLRTVLGPGLSDKMWEGTVGHAKSCTTSNKLYIHRRHGHILILSPICEVKGIVIDGHTCPPESLDRWQHASMQQLVLEAYEHWDQLEEVDEAVGRAVLQQQSIRVPQIGMGSSSSSSTMYHPNQEVAIAPSYQRTGSFDVEELLHGDVQVEFSGWIPNPGCRGFGH